MEILIFKTNIAREKDLEAVAGLLDIFPYILGWNVDRMDCDKILRIIATQNHSTEIIHTLEQAGYFCEELPD